MCLWCSLRIIHCVSVATFTSFTPCSTVKRPPQKLDHVLTAFLSQHARSTSWFMQGGRCWEGCGVNVVSLDLCLSLLRSWVRSFDMFFSRTYKCQPSLISPSSETCYIKLKSCFGYIVGAMASWLCGVWQYCIPRSRGWGST